MSSTPVFHPAGHSATHSAGQSTGQRELKELDTIAEGVPPELIEGKSLLKKNKTICVYGLHKKLPVSLKPFQWELLYQFMMSGELHKFIKENESKLK